MEEAQDRTSIFKSIDWFVILLYVLMLVGGWISVCGASYDFSADMDFFSFESRAGKQMVWMGLSFIIAFVLMMTESRIYEMFSPLLYTFMVVLLLATPFLAHDTKGSLSWIELGPVKIQPAEFAKFTTALYLAKFMNTYGFSLMKLKNLVLSGLIVLLPMVAIISEKETGSALVYMAFSLVFYREGMPGSILFSGISFILYFVIGLRFQDEMMGYTPVCVGRFCVFLMILVFSIGMVWVYCKNRVALLHMSVFALGGTALALLFSFFVIPFDVTLVMLLLVAGMIIYLIYLGIRERLMSYFLIAVFAFGSVGFHYSTDYVMNHVMESHQRTRINVLLGIEEDLAGAGYNVNQSKIAIGSGGLLGKGFLKGTQTKLKYVPEQDTDFIFCTVGEEEGFVGCAAVLLLFLFLILRLIHLAERQPSTFGRVYGYSVLSIFLFHLFINVGMVLGLTPVIGIPLPFFSYGGSSIWGFTLLLFIFLRIDAERNRKKR